MDGVRWKRRPPYDVWIDSFERGMSSARISPLFDALKPDLVRLLTRLREAGAGSDAERTADGWLAGQYPLEAQKTLSTQVAAQLGFDMTRGRLDLSVHPFTGTCNDVADCLTVSACGSV